MQLNAIRKNPKGRTASQSIEPYTQKAKSQLARAATPVL